ncbi:hypothetical protein ADIS_2970 [Lunatimonas lonarensis]|uniref:Uncharacterized protein n=1 Tax=Lunatimonas lonarensis TaxID=1232681 RepID=R7ZQX7_9BACT|nr:hypothetical protein ADIS_2970 [Lunatimonas lonarensis]
MIGHGLTVGKTGGKKQKDTQKQIGSHKRGHIYNQQNKRNFSGIVAKTSGIFCQEIKIIKVLLT